jgi:hypothetical protein
VKPLTLENTPLLLFKAAMNSFGIGCGLYSRKIFSFLAILHLKSCYEASMRGCWIITCLEFVEIAAYWWLRRSSKWIWGIVLYHHFKPSFHVCEMMFSIDLKPPQPSLSLNLVWGFCFTVTSDLIVRQSTWKFVLVLHQFALTISFLSFQSEKYTPF